MYDQEFALFIHRILEEKMKPLGALEGHDLTPIIKYQLGHFMWLRAVDTMEWILLCAMGQMEFDQTLESHVPTICKYYNSFIGEDNWGDREHTFMMVLNKYEDIKANGHGNFARLISG